MSHYPGGQAGRVGIVGLIVVTVTSLGLRNLLIGGTSPREK